MDRDQTNNGLFNDDPVLHTIRLYYQEGKSQTRIAVIMGVSHITVVKYLQTARENGLVHISLDMNVFGSIDAASQIRDKFNLQRVIIVPDGEYAGKHNDTELIQTRLSYAGGMCLDQVIENGDTLEIVWRRTIHQVSETTTPKSCKNAIVIQTLGPMPSQPNLTIIESSSQTVYRLSGRITSLHVPATVSNAGLVMKSQAEPIIRSNLDVLTRCTKTFFVVGNAFDENPLIRVDVLNKKEMQTYRDLDVVGAICSHFYDEEGTPVVTDVDRRILGISLAQLRQIKRKISLVGRERGYDTTLGTLLGGYVTDLIVDEGTAELLLACESPH